MKKWCFIEYTTDGVTRYGLAEITENYSMKRSIFEIQIPDVNLLPENANQDSIRDDLYKLKAVLPGYMRDICCEHNGEKRMSIFPDLDISRITFRETAIFIGNGNASFQIGGCHTDDVGQYFTKYFVLGLAGKWRGIDFSGCDNPTYYGDEDE